METLSMPCMASSNIGATSSLFGTLVQTILAAQCAIPPQPPLSTTTTTTTTTPPATITEATASDYMWPNDYGLTATQTGLLSYDFIIVGGGTAGSVLANRLSENVNWNILLLEAGDNPSLDSEIPGLAFTFKNSTNEWKYYSQPSNKSTKGKPHVSTLTGGKMLGGSSSINNFIYSRGNSRDYDDWAAMGNPLWNWASVLEDFKKAENLNIPELQQNYGIGGPIKLKLLNSSDILSDILTQAAGEIGFQTNLYNDLIGLSQLLTTIDNGTRSSPARGYLASLNNRTNLHVIKNAHVTKILFLQSANMSTAIGVEFMLNQQLMRVLTTKDVILSAGAINTPQLLMLSGIGKDKHAKRLNITTVSSVPIGKTLQDHAIVNVFYQMVNSENVTMTESQILESNINEYLINKTGSFANIPIAKVTGLFNTVNLTDQFPDIQVFAHHFKKGEVLRLEDFLQVHGYNNSYLLPIIDTIELADVIVFSVMGLNPLSTGKIRLNSSDPFEAPIIEANYLKKKEDVRTLVRGIRLVQSLQFTQAFRQHGIQEIKINIPECGPYLTDQFWECYVRYMSTSANHPVGSVRMGPLTDKNAAVDERLRVRGVNNLRVVDASIMPRITSGGTMGPVIMIGEKGAKFIHEDWAISQTTPRDEL